MLTYTANIALDPNAALTEDLEDADLVDEIHEHVVDVLIRRGPRWPNCGRP